MPITTLDPSVALVVIDLQAGIVAAPTARPAAEVVASAAALARAFRARGAPVVLVNVAGGPPGRTEAKRPALPTGTAWTELVPELDRQPSDIAITKYCIGAFYGTALDLHLRRRGVTQLVLAGISTSAGVESTARAGFDRGYHIVFATDAMTDRNPEAHQHCLDVTFPRFGELATVADVLAKLG